MGDVDLLLKSIFLDSDEELIANQPEPVDVVGTILERTRFSLPESNSLAKSSGWDEQIGSGGSTGEPLEKMLRQSTRKIALTEFVKRSLAVGETVADLVAHAEKHDRETATLLREIGDELEAA